MENSALLAFISAIGALAVAMSVVWHERRSLAKGAFVAGMLLLALEAFFSGLGLDSFVPDQLIYWQNWKLLIMGFLPGIWLVFSLTYARGEPRRFLARWRLLLVSGLLVPMVIEVIAKGKLVTSLSRSPAGDDWSLGVGMPGLAFYIFFVLGTVLVLMNLESTFRAAVGTMRWRVKYMLLGLGLLFAVRAYTGTQTILFHSINLSLQPFGSLTLLVACILVLRTVMRVGHFEVEVYPSEFVLHNSFTVLLAGVYLLIVGVLARVVAFFGGTQTLALRAFVILVVLLLLSMLLLSDRVRLYVRRFASRRLQRPLYDYRSVWRTFTEKTARCVEETHLCKAMVVLVSDMFQALSVTIWLADDSKSRFTFGASTSIAEAKAERFALDATDAPQVIDALALHPEPIDLDESKENWASLLRRLHPGEFPEGGNRISAPLISGGELLGVMTIGDRVGGMRFTLQDFDLLKCVSEQAASCLFNIRLSNKLTQVRQLEAFQTMSAFFVHDLKNTASTLSLMLQNLPLHFQDPDFREDMLRGVSRTVTHINDLVARLGSLREEFTLKPVESDLNAVVTAALRGLQTPLRREQDLSSQLAPSDLTTELRPLPKAFLDQARIQSVVTNLVLNAREATGSAGKIIVETCQRNGWVILEVTDTGCGMQPEFVQRSLFRPFKTTKKQGIGIGMFQCKMIVDAHRGRIEVESAPGRGTSFRVLLPIANGATS